MSSVNKQILVGRVGRDPEIRHTNSGKSVASFSVATSRKRDGQEVTTWHNCTAFDKTAELVEKYVVKGMLVYLEGETVHEEWTDRDNNKRTSTKVLVNNIQFLGGKKQDDNDTPF